MLAFNFFGATEGGLFDINATLPLMAIQVVALTYILNSLFFKPVGNVVEKREKFVSNNIMDAKNKLSEVEKLEADLLSQLQSARSEAQKIVSEAENESDKLYKEALELANNEANASKEKARLEIENQTSSARDQLLKQADDLSELIVNRLILEK
jgi:F-type H+-transporting ATPase subunit b